MVVGRKIIAVLVGALAITATVHADMMPVSGLDADGWQPAHARSQPDLQDASSPVLFLFGGPDLANLNSLSVEFLPEAGMDGGESGEMLHPRNIGNGPGSLDLCLYALVGLGLCKSGPWLKRLSFGVIPDWYHDGGPYQIGHSHVISPDCLSAAPVFCFIQPGSGIDDLSPLAYRFWATAFLWRISQATVATAAPRGPPSML